MGFRIEGHRDLVQDDIVKKARFYYVNRKIMTTFAGAKCILFSKPNYNVKQHLFEKGS